MGARMHAQRHRVTVEHSHNPRMGTHSRWHRRANHGRQKDNYDEHTFTGDGHTQLGTINSVDIMRAVKLDI